MNSPEALLLALQHGDGFFPRGANAFSWGLETLAADRSIVCATDMCQFVEGQLRYRWATSDRPALFATHRASGRLSEVQAIDDVLDAMALSREMREGSRKAGRAMLDVHAALGTPGADEYRVLVKTGPAHGHLAVVQGLVWFGVGLCADDAAALSGHLLYAGFVGAAIRLGLIGHLDAQVIIAQMRSVLAEILAHPSIPFADIRTCSPASEIAMMRHEVGIARMFAN